jgi:hypothetical protein
VHIHELKAESMIKDGFDTVTQRSAANRLDGSFSVLLLERRTHKPVLQFVIAAQNSLPEKKPLVPQKWWTQ